MLLETHDAFLTGARVADVLAAVGSPRWARSGTRSTLARREARTAPPPCSALDPARPAQDVAAPTDLRPVLPGHGTLPLAAVVEQARRRGYRGWISLEWERAWYPEVPALDRALTAFHRVLDALGPPANASPAPPATPPGRPTGHPPGREPWAVNPGPEPQP
ncbi:hypothetical protein NKH77_06410 [Streptomyces sp. M19]